jgi:hypothetical protein
MLTETELENSLESRLAQLSALLLVLLKALQSVNNSEQTLALLSAQQMEFELENNLEQQMEQSLVLVSVLPTALQLVPKLESLTELLSGVWLERK